MVWFSRMEVTFEREVKPLLSFQNEPDMIVLFLAGNQSSGDFSGYNGGGGENVRKDPWRLVGESVEVVGCREGKKKIAKNEPEEKQMLSEKKTCPTGCT